MCILASNFFFKCRAFDKRDNKFKDVFGLTNISLCLEENSTYPVVYEPLDFFVIQWYTGFNDSSGAFIYTGDLFGKLGGDVDKPNEYEIHAEVYFDSDLGAFCIDDQRGGWEYLHEYLSNKSNEREVIGNILTHGQ